MRNYDTQAKANEINDLWMHFHGTKEEFMATLEGVTADIRVEPAFQSEFFPSSETSYYCTVVGSPSASGFCPVYEVYSYDDGEWYCKC